ncbi:MAG: putative small lipoprotein YifL [Methylophagaceae bacterium]|jgi:predicted small lipoprotein YifL
MQTLKKIARLTALIFLLGIVSACGQKGDLYLPPSTLTQVSAG